YLPHPLTTLCSFFSLQRSADTRALHSFPTRRSSDLIRRLVAGELAAADAPLAAAVAGAQAGDADLLSLDDLAARVGVPAPLLDRSEEHTSELQSRGHLVCRLLLEKKKKKQIIIECAC